MCDAVPEHEHPLALQVVEGPGAGGVLADEEGLVDVGVGLREDELPGPLLRVDHPLEHVDLPRIQEPPPHVRPVAEPELHLQAHHPGDGAGQLDVVAGRAAILVQELVGRIAAVPADDDDLGFPVLPLGGHLRRGRQAQEQQDGQQAEGEESVSHVSGKGFEP